MRSAALAFGFTFLAVLTGCPEEDDGNGGNGNGGEAVGGEGGTGGEVANGGSGGTDDPSARLFVVNTNDGVASFDDPAALDGIVSPETNLVAGADTDLFGPRDLAISPAGDMYVASENGPAVVVYANALSADGAVLPARKLAGASTGLEAPNGLELDAEDDTLYVINNPSLGITERAILAFESASTASGDIAPTRRIEVMLDGFSPMDIELEDDRLYVVTQGANTSSIVVVDGASAADGQVTPNRTISHADFGAIMSIYVSTDDRLYAVDSESEVFIFDGASTLDGSPEPTTRTTIQGASGLSTVMMDASGTLYVADSSAATIYSFADAALPAGTATPTHTFDSVDIRLPSRLFVVEP